MLNNPGQKFIPATTCVEMLVVFCFWPETAFYPNWNSPYFPKKQNVCTQTNRPGKNLLTKWDYSTTHIIISRNSFMYFPLEKHTRFLTGLFSNLAPFFQLPFLVFRGFGLSLTSNVFFCRLHGPKVPLIPGHVNLRGCGGSGKIGASRVGFLRLEVINHYLEDHPS